MSSVQPSHAARPDAPEAADAARRLAAASDERRRAVERLLHDGVQQHMALLGLKLSMLQKRITTDPDAAVAACDELREEIQGALRELRAVAHLIYPAILENEGLGSALRQAADRLGVRARVDVAADLRLPSSLSAAFYFCALEALDNAARHAGSDASVAVRVAAEGDHAVFEVSDDGQGFDVPSPHGSSGLQYVTDRVEALGGVLEIVSSTGQGTRVRGTVPLTDAA